MGWMEENKLKFNKAEVLLGNREHEHENLCLVCLFVGSTP